MSALMDLPNIGPTLAKELEAIGILNKDQLIDCGSVEAVIKLQISHIHACLNKLYALEGAIQGVRWHDFTPETRKQLKEQYLAAVREAL